MRPAQAELHTSDLPYLKSDPRKAQTATTIDAKPPPPSLDRRSALRVHALQRLTSMQTLLRTMNFCYDDSRTLSRFLAVRL